MNEDRLSKAVDAYQSAFGPGLPTLYAYPVEGTDEEKNDQFAAKLEEAIASGQPITAADYIPSDQDPETITVY